MTISTDFDNYLCIFTNLLCIIPSILFFLDNNIYDGIYVLYTGTISLIYHINNNEPQILDDKLVNPTLIANIDTLYSETLIINIASYLLFYKNLNIRASLCAFLIPIYIYLNTIDSVDVAYIRYSFIIIMGLIAIVKYFTRYFYKKNLKTKKFLMLIFAAFLNGIEVLAFEYLQNRYTYNFYHSIHHICAFTSICLYFYGPITHNSPYYYNKKRLIVNVSKCCKHSRKVTAEISPRIICSTESSNIANLNIPGAKNRFLD
jgi:hypothetical protein